jgi:hypothetical protein
MTSARNLLRGVLGAWTSQPDRARMRLRGFRPMRKGNVLGFARIELPIGLRISNIQLFTGGDGLFAALMSKPVFGGRQRSRPQYSREATFADGLTQSAKPGSRSSLYIFGCKE